MRKRHNMQPKSFNLKAGMMLSFLAFLFASFSINAQERDNLKTELFRTTDKLYDKAIKVDAHLLSPDAYEKGVKHYKEAEEDFQDEDDLKEIKEGLQKSMSYFNEAINHIDIAEPTFSNVLAARNDAMETKAPIAVSEKWEEAEECFKNAAEELEDGDLESAKKEGKRAVSLYREAEIESIKTTFLSNASTLIEKADDMKADKYAPITFERAKQLYENAEKEIENNKEDTDYARQLARQSEFEAKHAIYLAKTIESFDDKDYTMENVLLMSEEPLMKISYVLGTDVSLDSGYDVIVDEIITKIAENQEKIGDLSYDLYASQQEIFDLEQYITEQKMFYELKLKQKEAMEEEKVQNLKNEVAIFQEKQDLLKSRMERREMIDASYKKVENIFAKSEANVFRQGDDIIMRLTGVNFSVGKAYIPEESYSLLNKAISAIDEFSNVKIVIEGHTDSKGGDALNQTLSENRAKAVKEYMVNNSGLNKENIKSKGYGETKPLASNETEKGRTQNRRIDIVIQPVFEEMQ